jgi:hypothetical protein
VASMEEPSRSSTTRLAGAVVALFALVIATLSSVTAVVPRVVSLARFSSERVWSSATAYDASFSDREAPTNGYDIAAGRAIAAPNSQTPSGFVNATNTASGARFVVNGAGEALDTARVTIPNGKFGYLLENPSKSGVFADSMGFNQSSLDSAIRSHLVDNFGNATPSVAMTGGGTKFSVTGPMVGPSGAKWTITTAWGVDADGTIRLITATP